MHSRHLPKNLLLVKIEIHDDIEIQPMLQKVLVKGWDSFPFVLAHFPVLRTIQHEYRLTDR